MWTAILPFCFIIVLVLNTGPIQHLKAGTCARWSNDHFSWVFGVHFVSILFFSFLNIAHEKLVFRKMNSPNSEFCFSFYFRVIELARAVISLVRKVSSDL